MRLITGPSGSGKTRLVLDEFRSRLRQGDHGVRLLVPTATLAQHLQNQLARDGYVFPVSIIDTFSGFVDLVTTDLPPVLSPVLSLMTEHVARRVARPEFAQVAHLPGFCSALSRTIEELSSAGCDSARLGASLPAGPLSTAFLAIYREVELELVRRGLWLRARRLDAAADRIEREGASGIRTVWLDGFHALPDPELRVIAALGRHCDLTLSLADSDVTEETRGRLREFGFVEERAARPRGTPATVLMRARSMEREVEEIARRILEQAAAGRPFREMGIVVRAPEIYAPILRSTLERFGIPARFYSDSRLDEHAVTRYLCGVVDAMLGGWDHAHTLEVLRLAPRFADSRVIDEFEFDVREQIPNGGLGALKALLVDVEGHPKNDGAARLLHKIDAIGAIEEWRSFSLAPRDWAGRLRTLRALFRPPQFADRIPHEDALLWRGQAAVLDAFDEAVDNAALALDPNEALKLPEYWRAVKAIVRLTPLRFKDNRRNVVHVLPAHEARQWVLPVVFVCGMVEKQFPHLPPQDAFFGETARRELNQAGIRIRTAAEMEREEHALFHSAASRATLLTTLSYPEFDSRGERNLPSIFLEGLALVPQEASAVRPRPRRIPAAPPAPAIRSPRLLDYLREKSGRLSPTGLEIYLQCPFQYFAGKTLRLSTAPPLPQERLDFMTQGSIVHQVLAEWCASRRDIAVIFQEIFERECEANRVPVHYHTERLRNAMLDDLRAFASDRSWPNTGFQSSMEQQFELRLEDALIINGKIDRMDVDVEGRAWIIDYKYSGAQRTKARLEDENLLQAPLYLLGAEKALHVRPAGMFYIGLKGKVEYAGWSGSGFLDSLPFPENWLDRTAARTLESAAAIRSGSIEPRPANSDNCRFCDFRDACRVEVEVEAEEAETT